MNGNQTTTQAALSVKDAAHYIGLSERTLQRLRDSKEIRCSKIGKRIVFRVSALDEYLERKEIA